MHRGLSVIQTSRVDVRSVCEKNACRLYVSTVRDSVQGGFTTVLFCRFFLSRNVEELEHFSVLFLTSKREKRPPLAVSYLYIGVVRKE